MNEVDDDMTKYKDFYDSAEFTTAVRPLKDKSNYEVKKEFQSILKEIGTVPKMIMSDNDSTFLSNDFTKLCEEKDIILRPNVVGDHNYLGIVDRFCRTIKFILAKFPNWNV